MWKPKVTDLSLAFATEDFEIIPLSQIRVIVQMNCGQEEQYRQCAEYYHVNCPSRTWNELAYKIYRSEYCARKQQTLEYMMHGTKFYTF